MLCFFLLITDRMLTEAHIVYQAPCEGLSHVLSQSSPWTSDGGFITPFLQRSSAQTAGEWRSQDAVSDLSIPQTSAFYPVLLASTIILGSTELTGDSPAPPSAIILQISSRRDHSYFHASCYISYLASCFSSWIFLTSADESLLKKKK